MDPFLGQELRQTISVAAEAGTLIAASPEVERLLFGFKVFALIISTLLVIGIMALVVKLGFFSWQLKSARTFILMSPDAGKEKTSRQWEKIKRRLNQGSDAEMRLAVIEADQLFDSMLKKMNLPGSTMGERLKALRPWQLDNLPDVWIAHKMRNRLVHEPSSRISPHEAEIALQIYEKALHHLGLLG